MNAYFWLVYIVTIVSAVVALEAPSLIWAAISFVVLLSEIALLYFGLNMPVLGGIQLAVYAGGVTVLVLFAIMMIGESEVKSVQKRPAAVLLALLTVLVGVFISFASAIDTFRFMTFKTSEFGGLFSGRYAMLIVFLAFVVASVLYLGSAVISKSRGEG